MFRIMGNYMMHIQILMLYPYMVLIIKIALMGYPYSAVVKCCIEEAGSCMANQGSSPSLGSYKTYQARVHVQAPDRMEN